MLKQKKLNKLNTGEVLDHFLLLSKIEVKKTRTNKEYLDLQVKDDTLSLSAKIWDGFGDFYMRANEGDVVKFNGTIEDYRGQPQIRVDNFRLAEKSDGVSPNDFVAKSKRNLDEMVEELKTRIERIENPHLKKLLNTILSGELVEKYINAPAGKAWHHAYLHGLLEHTLEIIKICDLICDFHPEVKRDLLITGAVLHDIGKTEELTSDANFDYTDKGRLIGHIVIAATLVESNVKSIPNFPEMLKNKLIHLILSHQGKLEFASPVEPKTLEAIILYHADELSAKTNAYKNAIETDKSGKSNWTKYLPLANTSLYIDRDEEDSPKETLFDT